MYKNRPQRPRRRPGKDQDGPTIYPERTEKPQGPGFHRCPLCGTVLEKSEKVRSVIYPGKPDSMMEIFGCPYCYGGPIGSGTTAMKKRSTRRLKARLCPVCKKELPQNGLVYARFFQSSDRRHAHVLGCTQCYTRRRR
ncbi:MAG: hypothetical protein ACOC7X_04265 [Spirochaetota bacterium]